MVLYRSTLVLCLLLLSALLLTSCKSSSKTAKLPKNLPKISVSSASSSPPHRMSRGEYPFDSRGNYVTTWAAEGDRQRRSSGYAEAAPADYSDWQDSHQTAPAPAIATAPAPKPAKKSSFSLFGRRSSSSSAATSTPPPPSPTPSPTIASSNSSSAPVMVLSSTGSSSRVTTAPPPSRPPSVTSTVSKPVVSTSSAPKKPAPKPTSTSSSITHTVKSGDTLYGIALRYKSTVAKIKSANALKSDLIRPGQKLRVPR